MASQSNSVQRERRDFHWRGIGAGVGISIVLTLAIGLPLMITQDNVWWMAWTGVIGIFIGGLVAGRLAQTNEPLNGAMVALIYFSIIAIVYLVGQATELLPDPLPGLPQDDSTFFFVWPLTQIVAGTLGSVLGGKGRTTE
jgi:hypothetical protein